MEVVHEADACGNEQATQHDGSANTPQQRPPLTPGANSEALKQDHENKQVVDRERDLDRIACYKFQGWLATMDEVDPEGEGGGCSHQKGRTGPCPEGRVLACFATAKHHGINCQQQGTHEVEAHPPDQRYSCDDGT